MQKAQFEETKQASKPDMAGMLELSDWEFKTTMIINNKVLLYSTGNYIQYPVINHNGKE